jgi:hypothetical protein
VALARRARRGASAAERALLLAAVILPALFALLLTSKTANYLVSIAPVWAAVVAWSAVQLWQAPQPPRRRAWLRGLVVLAVLAIAVEGVSRYWVLERSARTTRPQSIVNAAVLAHVQPGDRILGPHTYWFGFTEQAFISWVVPLSLADPHSGSPGLGMAAALDRVAPDIILIDDNWGAYFRHSRANDPKPAELWRWLADRGLVLQAVIADPTYGRIEVYRRP